MGWQITEIFARYDSSKEKFKDSYESPAERRTIFHEVLMSDAPDHEKTIERMTQEAMGVVSAASETTSNTVTTIIYHLLSNPAIKQRLVDELDGVMKDPKKLIEWKKLDQLPYLVRIAWGYGTHRWLDIQSLMP